MTRYGLGDDIVVLSPGDAGDIVEAREGVPGLTGLADPLDLVEDPATGCIYVSEMPRDEPDKRRITLLRPRPVPAATDTRGARR